MAIDRGQKSNKSWVQETERTAALDSGTKIEGTCLGIVKNNIDPARRGRIQVWIPDTGGIEDDRASWKTVSYASPFIGATGFPKKPKNNQFDQVPHTYGMWFASPDIGDFVLITFVAGDPARGYWFASVPSTVSHYMVPGMGSIKEQWIEPGTNDGVTGTQYPVVEYNDQQEGNNAYEKFPFNKKPVHSIQWKVFYDQGLEKDTVRGPVTSTSHRESPSRVFGVSTPGRPVTERTGVTPDEMQIPTRKGGHTFVLDDGDKDDKDRMMRLRTAGGHQIMLNDSEEIIYIANSAGTSWLEFDTSGKIHLYGKDSISVRTENEVNIHADKDINVHSQTNINMYATDSIKLESKLIQIRASEKLHQFGQLVEIASVTNFNQYAASVVNIKGGSNIIEEAPRIDLNGPGAVQVATPAIIPQITHKETVKSGKIWEHTSSLQSIVKIVPTHEPSTSVHKSHETNAVGPIGAPGGTASTPTTTPVTLGNRAAPAK